MRRVSIGATVVFTSREVRWYIPIMDTKDTTITTRRGTVVEVINCGNFLLDGGTMFGRVPKVLWEQWQPTDDKNRIVMATNVMRMVKDGRIYVVETGLGSRYTDKDWEIMGTGPDKVRLLSDPVDCLICTHLHWDHCGGIQDMEVRSEAIVSRTEWEDARGENPLGKGSYRAADLERLAEKLRLADPPEDVADGIRLIHTPGHTRGHMSVLVDDEVFYPGDLIPTAAHVHLPCIMAYDLYPLTVLETKKKILDEALRKNWTFVFGHDPYRPVGTIRLQGTRYSAI